MAKWADYAIYTVRFNAARTHIDRVRAFPDLGESLGVSVEFARMDVIAKIDQETTFVTAVKNADGNYVKGNTVYVVTVNSAKYIKTVKDNTTADNLDKLPEF